MGGFIGIYRPSGEAFGSMVRERLEDCNEYLLMNNAGQHMYTFQGNFREKTVEVRDVSSKLVCVTNRSIVDFDAGPHYQVRVATETDVALILCGLLTIDKLEGSTVSDD